MKGFIEIHPLFRGKEVGRKEMIAVDKIVRITPAANDTCCIITINDDFNDGTPTRTVESYDKVKFLIKEAL